MNTLAAPAPLRADATTIGVVSIAHGLSHFCQLIVPPLFPWIGAAFGLSNTELGLLLSVYFVVSFAGQALAGFVVDRFGADRVLYGGLALIGAAALGLAASPSYAAMFPFMALAGLGNCVFHPVDFSILNARVSPPRLGHAYAAHGISGNVGWALAPVFVVGITTATGSWRTALASVSVVVAAVLLLVWLYRAQLAVDLPRKAAAGDAGDSGFGFLKLPAVWACFAFFLVFAVALGGVQSFAPAAAAGCTTCRRRRWPSACRCTWWRPVPAWCWAATWCATRSAACASPPAALRWRRSRRWRWAWGTGRPPRCWCCSA
jgi:FSR family fosmidomycin resistance protein-like MFS transporter